MLIALAFLVIFYDQDSLWLAYSGMIPGAVAIRAIGRVVLILLVPAALGLACLVEFLDQRRLAIASWIVALVCLAEQGVTDRDLRRGGEPGVDRHASRAGSTEVGSRSIIIPIDDLPFFRHHLDAMWASLATGVPTVNGYSGHAPCLASLFHSRLRSR